MACSPEDLPPPGRLRRLRVLPARATRSGAPSSSSCSTDTVEAEGQRVVGWRDVPVDKDYVGITANLYAPYVKQLVVAASDELAADQDAFERKLYVIRRVGRDRRRAGARDPVASARARSSTRAC